MFKEITKDNWLLFAQQNYDNPTLTKENRNFMMILNGSNILKGYFESIR
jgi:hypothetical protein